MSITTKQLLAVTDSFIFFPVSDYSTSEQKATIQKLHPSDLKLLALTNLNLSELYKLKDFTKKTIFEEHTYNNLTIIENAPSIDVSLDLSVINNQPVEDTSTNLEVVNVIDENVPEIENVTQTDCTDVVEMYVRFATFYCAFTTRIIHSAF